MSTSTTLSLNVGIPTEVTNGLTYAFAILSSLSSFGAICLFAWLYKTNGHFIAREKLVLTLVIAGFINAVNTSLSTMAVVFKMPISAAQCYANGWIAQFSVQINDFTHFAIAIVTFYILTHRKSSYAMEVVERYIHYYLLVICIVPIITASVGGAVNGFAMSGTWCWFKGTPIEVANIVRYTLTHGPRIFIFITLICVYPGLWYMLSKKHNDNLREFKEMNISRVSGSTPSILNNTPIPNKLSKEEDEVTNAINKMLLYPVFYIILWSGGMANRVVEATGNKSDLTTFLQAFTRLVTFADSALFAYNYAWKKVSKKVNSRSTVVATRKTSEDSLATDSRKASEINSRSYTELASRKASEINSKSIAQVILLRNLEADPDNNHNIVEESSRKDYEV